jgi:hypothetical protein
LTIDAGAISGVVWHDRQAGSLIWNGRARYSERPVGVSRMPEISPRDGSVRKLLTMSVSHSTARLRGLVGLSAASL